MLLVALVLVPGAAAPGTAVKALASTSRARSLAIIDLSIFDFRKGFGTFTPAIFFGMRLFLAMILLIIRACNVNIQTGVPSSAYTDQRFPPAYGM
ncbi:hypothetical protein [Sinorhizobium meliloti]|uniref:hypothetical protein n=1 Tax=Rhizobium meliloti TaxID=382 RepID=UPI001E2C0F19|nr:hypothetical protein [Sinorhizobium meliloti]UFX12956.1 hypothetical protein SmelRRI128_32245 [Sinorhizobium meliloti]